MRKSTLVALTRKWDKANAKLEYWRTCEQACESNFQNSACLCRYHKDAHTCTHPHYTDNRGICMAAICPLPTEHLE
jgi:hypothetical protein